MPEVIEHSNADIYAIVRIEDPDEGRHGKVDSLEIVDGDAEAHFRIRQPSIDEPNEFNIEVLRLLDREISPYGYNLTLKVKKFLKAILNFVQLNEFQCRSKFTCSYKRSIALEKWKKILICIVFIWLYHVKSFLVVYLTCLPSS